MIQTYTEMLLARGVAILGSFGVAIVTARMLGAAERGRYYYIVTLAAIGFQLASLGIHASNTYLIARRPALLAQIMANTAWIAVVAGLVSAVGVVLFDLAIGGYQQGYIFFVGAVFGLTPPLLLFLYLTNIAIALDRTRAFNGLIILNGLVSIATTLVAAYLSPTLGGFLVAAVAASLISSFVAWCVLARGVKVPSRFDFSLFYEGIAFALRAHVAVLLGFFMSRMSILVLRQYGHAVDLGYWSIAAQIADALLILPATIGLVLFPALVRAEGKARRKQYRAVLLQMTVLMAAVCLVCAALARPVITLIFGAAYDPAVAVILALLPGVFFIGLCAVASQFLSAGGIPLSQLMAWLCGTGLQAALSAALFGHVGIVGLAGIQSACAGFVAVWLVLTSFKIERHVRQHP